MDKPTDANLSVLLIDNEYLSRYTSYLACGLAKYRKIMLYGFSREEHIVTGAIQDKRIKFYCIEERMPKGTSILKRILRHLLIFPILFQAVTKTKFDIMHFQDRVPMLFLFFPILKLKEKTICCSLHEPENYPPTRLGLCGKLESLFFRMITQSSILTKYSDKIIVHSSFIKQRLIKKGIDENKIYIVPHFDYRYLLSYNKDDNHTIPININTYIMDVPNIFSGEPYVLFFGEIIPRKGINILIDAARIVRTRIGKEKLRILIAGRADRTNTSYLFDSLTQEDYEYIHIYNSWIPNFQISHLLRKATFLVLPYTKAFLSASGVLPLAYTFSKPVIASNVGSLPEYVDHGKTGLIFEAGNSSELADCIIELLQDNSKCTQMGKNAYQKLLREMSLERCCEYINLIYQQHEVGI